MENNNILLPLYNEQLTTINGIKFTHREIDVITSIIHMRGASKIASLLSISTRTVETHTANIMRKMDANSREGIIDFVEKAGHSLWIDQHYHNLLVQTEFKKLLRQVSRLLSNKSFVCSLAYERGENEHLLHVLKGHLNLCGIETTLHEISQEKSIPQSLLLHNYPPQTHIICKLPYRLVHQFQANKTKSSAEISHLAQEILSHYPSLTFLLTDTTNQDILQDFTDTGCVGFGKQYDYYTSFLHILKRIIPAIPLDKIISEFKKTFEAAQGISEKDLTITQSSTTKGQAAAPIIKRRKVYSIIVSVVLMVSVSLGVVAFKQNNRDPKIQGETKPTPSIRSDLLVPTDNTFLNRPNIIAKLEESLSNNEGIQAVALVGVGGAGKTTIARRFALQQNANVVWEFNAATRENLKDSFERLAYGLCKTEEEKKILMGLQNIKNKMERDEKILLFVKEKLKTISNWFLIYDNVDKFNDIQKYFPCDSKVWGQGKIIVTTSDSNTKNNSLIHNFIQIGELSPQDKFTLFMKIMTNEEETQFSPPEEELANIFLTDVPPFPLDISIAAYYLKSTHTPYEKYLERLKENSNDFETIQINVVKEASDYTKTRNRIITLSLKQLIDTQNDFGDLLLLISLLSSQNIPRDLLSNYKSDVVVDNFIYNLKKYSLVTSESSSNPIPTISIHRTTQEISLNYLIKMLNLPHNSPLLDSIISTLENYIVDATDKEDFSRMNLLAAHCEALLTHDHLLTETMKSSIEGALGCVYYYLRHNIKARQLLEESHVNLKKYYGEDHVKVAPVLVYLGNFYRSIGDYEKAKTLLEQSLVIYKKYPNYVKNARALGYLGVVYRDLGDYKKAKVLLEESLVIHEKYSENHIGHAWVLAHLGDIYMILGKNEKAKELFEKSLIIYKNHAEDYVGVGWVLNYLGIVHKSLGDCDKAKNLLEQSLSITRKYFSDDHLFVASGFSSLASIYTEMGNYEKAKNLLNDSLAVYERNYGKNHIETARVLRLLGEAYCAEGDMETSEDLINKSLLVFQQKNYPESYKSYESLALLFLKKEAQALSEGDIKQAQSFRNQAISDLKKALRIAKECFSDDSVHIEKIQLKLTSLETPL